MPTKFQQETLKSRFAQAKVLVVGDVMLDRYWFGDVSRISPEAPVPVAKIARIDQRAGGAANVARNIAKPIAVEHHISDNKDFGLCETGFEGFLLELGYHTGSIKISV